MAPSTTDSKPTALPEGPYSEYDTWPAKMLHENLVQNKWWDPINFYGLIPVVGAKNKTFNDSKGNEWKNTASCLVSGDPFSIENYMVMELNSSAYNQTNAETYSGDNDKEHKMSGVRGIYFESSTNGVNTNPMLMHCALMYKNVDSGFVSYVPLVHAGKAGWCETKYNLNPLMSMGPTWVPQRWVFSGNTGLWTSRNNIWVGVAWGMKVSQHAGGAKFAQCKVRRLRPIVDVGTNANTVTETNTRVVWGHFT